jgi:zinc transporter
MVSAVQGEIGGERGGLVNAHLLDGAGGAVELDWDGVERWSPDDGILWINLDYAGADAQAWLGMRSGLDPVVRDALLDKDPRPRALAIGDALLLIVRAINLNAGSEPEDMVSLRVWIESRRIITMRHRPIRAIKTIAADLGRGKGPRGPGGFVAEMIGRCLEPVVTCVDGIDDAVALVEDEVLGAHDRRLRAQIADLRRRAIALRRFIAPQREAFTRLAAAALPWLDEQDRAHLREAADRMTRTVEELDAARDRAAVTHEEMASRLGEVTNQRLYVLSIMTAIFLPLGFVTSLLGVNVGGIPGREVSWGFWALCAGFAIAIVVQLVLFRRWRWLGGADDRE